MSNDPNNKTLTCLSCGTPTTDASLDRCPRDGGHLVADQKDKLVKTLLLNRYFLQRVIGKGGWGSVYRAEDRLLHRDVAIKVLHEWLSFDRERLARFQREGEAVARLVHPNICTVYDFGFLNGRQPFIVMEYLEGETLRAYIEDHGKLPMAQALDLAMQACDALAAAYALGIVHRDIKPDNILLLANGQIKLVDFGLAKLTVDEENAKITSTGTTVGTPAYMSPEQCQGIPVDGAADIYSLGCVLFEMLTGKTPFAGFGYFDYMSQHVGSEPPLLADACSSEKFPLALEEAVMRALEKQPSARFKNADEFKEALEGVRDNQASESWLPLRFVASSWLKKKRWAGPIMIAGIGAIALTTACAFGLAGLVVAQFKPASPMPRTIVQSVPAAKPRPAPPAPVIADERKRLLAMAVLSKLQGNDELDLDTQNIQDLDVDYICSYLAERHIDLDILSMAGNPITDNGLVIFANRLDLVDLDVSDTTVTDLGVASFARVPLTDLNVLNTRVTGSCFARGFGHLQTLLAGGPAFQPRNLALIARLPFLEDFELHGRQFTDNDMRLLGRSRRLTKLCVNDAPISDEALKYLAHLPLRALDLERTSVTGSGLGYLQRTPLEDLVLPACDDEALKFVAIMPAIKKLQFEASSAMTPAGLQSLVPGKLEELRITRINAESDSLNDECLKVIGNMPRLKVLQLHSNAITDGGLRNLNRLPNLERITLDCAQVSDAAVAAFQKTHPQCRIHRPAAVWHPNE